MPTPPAISEPPSPSQVSIPPGVGAAVVVWARLMRLMRRMMLAMLALVALAAVAIWRHRGVVPVRFAIGAALVLGLVMVLGAGLMGGSMLLAHRRRVRIAPPCED